MARWPKAKVDAVVDQMFAASATVYIGAGNEHQMKPWRATEERTQAAWRAIAKWHLDHVGSNSK